jgi:hypothetical protein
MKYATHQIKRIILLTFVLLILSFVLTAQPVKISSGENAFEITRSYATSLGFKNKISQLDILSITTKGGDFSQILSEEYSHTMQQGAPMLPVLKKLMEVPPDAAFEIIIYNKKLIKINAADIGIIHQIMPVQPSVSKSDDPEQLPFILDERVYSKDEFYGQEPVTVAYEGEMRGVHIARLEVAPFSYNPVKGEIEIITDFECEILFKNGRHESGEAEKARVYSPWAQATFHGLINYQKPDLTQGRALIDAAPATYIIVSPSMFQAALQPFVEWKTKKGFRVVEAYTNDPSVGSTTTSIKNYLKNFYQNPPAGYHPQSFVLIVGDVAQVPAFNGTAGSHVTDLYYCEYTNDKMPECFYGRFSATNLTQLQPQIDKTLQYEQYTFPDPSFLDEVVMVAGYDNNYGPLYGNGQINYGTEHYFNAAHGIYSHTYLQPEPSGGNYAANIRQNVSNGVAYANYTAHCSKSGWANPSFLISHVSSLNNAGKYPLMVGNCCQSVQFNQNSFGEEVLRASQKGAIGYVGGSNNTYWNEDFWWGVGMKSVTLHPAYNQTKLGAYDRMFHDRPGITINDWYITQGQMPSAGNLAVMQSNSSLKNYYWEIYHLMGDPSLMVYFSQPPDISANYPSLIPILSETFTVNTDPYAYVAISKAGVLHGAAMADASGVAEVALDPITQPGNADVVITGQNLKPFIGTVTVGELPASQTISISEGWNGISGNLIPQNCDIETLLGDHLNHLVIFQNMEGVFYPEVPINTLGDWDYHSGYLLKASAPFELNLSGFNPENRSIQLTVGWNLIPVLLDCNLNIQKAIEGINDKLVVVKAAAGNAVYWPEYNINTIGAMQPGEAYFILMTEEAELQFGECE